MILNFLFKYNKACFTKKLITDLHKIGNNVNAAQLTDGVTMTLVER